MIYLILSILSSSLIYLVFKLLGRFKIQLLQALIINYITAFLIGLSTQSNQFNIESIVTKPWFVGCLLLGFMFILVFSLMAKTTQLFGMSVVSVASKMSVAVPVSFVLWYYQEGISFFKLIGIFTALVSVLLVSLKSKSNFTFNFKNLLLPLLVFLGSGIIETSLKFLEQDYVSKEDIGNFSLVIFFFAAFFGLIIIVLKGIKKKIPVRFSSKDILGGIALGIPNFYSIYFFISALKSELLPSSLLFVLNNVSIVVFSTLLGVFLFKEKLSKNNWLGIGLALASIALLYFSTDLI